METAPPDLDRGGGAPIDLVGLLPPGPVRRVIVFCLTDLGLTLEQTERTVFDAAIVLGAIDTLLRGGVMTTVQPRESPGEALPPL